MIMFSAEGSRFLPKDYVFWLRMVFSAKGLCFLPKDYVLSCDLLSKDETFCSFYPPKGFKQKLYILLEKNVNSHKIEEFPKDVRYIKV